MAINRTVGIHSELKVGTEIVGRVSANLNTTNNTVTITANITNKDLADKNAKAVKEQYKEFESEVKSTAAELGYPLF